MNLGRTIRMYLVDGSASGLITAEIMNWTGHAVLGPRSKLKELLAREEAQRTGVYLLYGPDPETGQETLYVGEGDDVGKRIRQHASDANKDFFERICLLTSKDHNLTKAHVRFLESRMIALVASAGRVALNNATQPDPIRLPEADVSDMEFFIDQVRLILPALGLDFLRALPVHRVQARPQETDNPVFFASAKKHGIRAEMQEIDGEFVVLAGSLSQNDWVSKREATHSTGYAKLHADLRAQGKLAPGPNGLCEFTVDVAFKSPSAAAAVVFGRPANGRLEWQIEATKQTLGEWQNAQLSTQGEEEN